MKKFSMNLLKVGLLSILGLCMIGMSSAVNAVGELKRIDPDGEVNKVQLQGFYFVNRGYRQKVAYAIQDSCYNNSGKIVKTAFKGDGDYMDAEKCGQTDGAAGPFYFLKKGGLGDSADHCLAAYVLNLDLGLSGYNHKKTYSSEDSLNWEYQGAYIYEFTKLDDIKNKELTLKLDYKGTSTGTLKGTDIETKLKNADTIDEIFGVDGRYMDDDKTTVSYKICWIRNYESKDLPKDYAKLTGSDKLLFDVAKIDKYFKENPNQKLIKTKVQLNIGVTTNSAFLPSGVAVSHNRTSDIKTGFFVYIYNPYYGQTSAQKVKLTMEFGDGVNKHGNHSEQGQYNKGATITLNRNNGSNKVTREGYELVGWKVKNSTIEYTDGGSNNTFKINADTTLVAIWEAKDIYTMVYGDKNLDKNTKTVEISAVNSQSQSINAKWSILSGSEYATLSATQGERITVTAKDNVKGDVKIQIEYNGKTYETTIHVDTTTTTGGGGNGGGGNGTPVKAKDANGDEIVVGKYLQYKDVTKEGGWNIHRQASSSRFNEIEDGDIVLVKELDNNGTRYVKVEVVKTSVEGLEGKTGWLNVTSNGAKNFTMYDKIEDIPVSGTGQGGGNDQGGNGSNIGLEIPGLSNFDTEGIMGIVFDILGRLFDFLMKNVLPNIGPMIETASKTVLPLAEKVIGSILQ